MQVGDVVVTGASRVVVLELSTLIHVTRCCQINYREHILRVRCLQKVILRKLPVLDQITESCVQSGYFMARFLIVAIRP